MDCGIHLVRRCHRVIVVNVSCLDTLSYHFYVRYMLLNAVIILSIPYVPYLSP